MWKVTQHKTPKAQQEIKVSIAVKEMAQNTYATAAPAFIDAFKNRMAEIPRSNNFAAELLYQCKELCLYKVEIDKLDVQGNFKYKMFTLEFEK